MGDKEQIETWIDVHNQNAKSSAEKRKFNRTLVDWKNQERMNQTHQIQLQQDNIGFEEGFVSLANKSFVKPKPGYTKAQKKIAVHKATKYDEFQLQMSKRTHSISKA